MAASTEPSARVTTFLNSRPETPARAEPWLRVHPAFDALAASGLDKMFDDLLRGVMSDMPPDLRPYVLAKLHGEDPGMSAVAPFNTHEVRAKTTECAIKYYVAEKRVMEFFAAMIEVTLAEMRDGALPFKPVDFLVQYLTGIEPAASS